MGVDSYIVLLLFFCAFMTDEIYEYGNSYVSEGNFLEMDAAIAKRRKKRKFVNFY